MTEYTKQIEKTALQLREGEQLLDIDRAWLIPADISYQVFSKNPFLLTETEANLLLRSPDWSKEKSGRTTQSEFGCVPTI